MVGDVVFQGALGLGLGSSQGAGIEAADPAFSFADGAGGGGVVGQLFDVDAADGDHVQALEVFILFVAGVHGHPAVGRQVNGAARGTVVDGGFDPDVLYLDVADLAAALHRTHRDAAGGGVVGGGEAVVKAPGPVVEACSGQFNGAVDVARGDAGGTQARRARRPPPNISPPASLDPIATMSSQLTLHSFPRNSISII